MREGKKPLLIEFCEYKYKHVYTRYFVSYSSYQRIMHYALYRVLLYRHYEFSSGPPSAPTLMCDGLSGDGNGTVNVTVSWTLRVADFYLINITTNAPQTPYGGRLNITTTNATLTGFMAGYQYSITVHGICGGQEGSESQPLAITPQGICVYHCSSIIQIMYTCTYILAKP